MATHTPKFHAAMYNMVAKRIRERFETHMGIKDQRQARNELVELSLEFARTFLKDNEQFDPRKFLDQCSPNPEMYPMSELWEDYANRWIGSTKV